MRLQKRLFLTLPLLLLLLGARQIAAAQRATPGVRGDSNAADRILPSSETIYVTNYRDNTIQMFSLAGVNLGVFARLADPTGLVFDDAGNLYVSSATPGADLIQRFAPDGSGSVFASSGVDSPHALVFDRAGNLYVANPGNETIGKFTPDGVGTVFADTEDGLNNPLDLVFDAAGDLFVSNSYGGSTGKGFVQKFTPDGVGTLFANGGFHLVVKKIGIIGGRARAR